MNGAYAEILELLRRYYEGLYRCDADTLRSVFHPQARYCTVSGGDLLHLGMDDYLPIVAARASPEAQGEPYGYHVESIALAGPATAMARMRSKMWGRSFDDFLALVQLDGEWRIISKVFHFDEDDATAGPGDGDKR